MEQAIRPETTIDTAVSDRLIAYIGNKRAILPFIASVLHHLDQPGATFLDPFCGSGAVSRLAKSLGMHVAAADWEPYAWIVTAASLENTPREVDQLFAGEGGISRVLEELNTMDGTPSEPYISIHYAPRSTEQPRIGVERLFYTAENARFIDNVRREIERRFPPGGSEAGDRRRRLVLASLIYEASVHANTSGVFKAYHRGFGGHGRDALKRILGRMTLEPPSIPPGPPGTVEMTDALDFVRHRTGTICYLDPPYSSHQYGSNYFMLNTIALWDRPPVDDERDVDGHLLRKAGIRPDWVRTRSEFCSKRRAQAALEELVDAVDSRYLVMSYSTDGIIELEAIADILSRHGMLTVRASDHVTYRGGRQCNTRKTANAELLFVVDRHKPTGRRNVERSLLEARLAHSLRRSYRPERIREKFAVDGSRIILLPGWALASEHLTGFLSPTPSPGTASLTELRSVADALDWCACPDRETELEVLLKLLVRLESGEVRRVARRALTVLRKLAHPRYVTQFRDGLAAFRGVVAARAGELRQAAQQLDSLERQVELRLEKGQATP